jgi:capsular polysaccharide biosynthesis protein
MPIRLWGKRKSTPKTLSTFAAGHGRPAAIGAQPLHHPDLMVCEDVLALTLSAGVTATFSGGLVDPATLDLVPQAIHFDGGDTQELPDRKRLVALRGKSPVPGTWLFGGILFNDFPHFMLESLGRLWARRISGLECTRLLFFAPWGLPDCMNEHNFVNQTLRGFGIPLDDVVFIDADTRIERVLIPKQKYGYKIAAKPDADFVDFLRSFQFDHVDRFAYRKLYVSRSRLPSRAGRPIAESIIEKLLDENGYVIFHPQDHDLYTQLSTYESAERLIFCDGGALHACVLLPDLAAEIAVIARRRDPRWESSDIGEQFVGLGKRFRWIDQVNGQYQFGLETWEALSHVDWIAVSAELLREGFIEKGATLCAEPDRSRAVHDDLGRFIRSIVDDARFLDYMAALKDHLPPDAGEASAGARTNGPGRGDERDTK